MFEEQEAKFERLKGKLAATVTKQASQAKKCQLAYVDAPAKPPREVLRKQKMYGTSVVRKPERPVNNATAWTRTKIAPSITPLPRQRETKTIAPLMQKTKTMIKRMRH